MVTAPTTTNSTKREMWPKKMRTSRDTIKNEGHLPVSSGNMVVVSSGIGLSRKSFIKNMISREIWRREERFAASSTRMAVAFSGMTMGGMEGEALRKKKRSRRT